VRWRPGSWKASRLTMNRSHFVSNEEKLYKVDDKTVVLSPSGQVAT
jgi:hypothetical protein